MQGKVDYDHWLQDPTVLGDYQLIYRLECISFFTLLQASQSVFKKDKISITAWFLYLKHMLKIVDRSIPAEISNILIIDLWEKIFLPVSIFFWVRLSICLWYLWYLTENRHWYLCWTSNYSIKFTVGKISNKIIYDYWVEIV